MQPRCLPGWPRLVSARTRDTAIYSAASRDDPVCQGFKAPPRRPGPPTPTASTPGGREERAVPRPLAVRCNLKPATVPSGISVPWKPGLRVFHELSAAPRKEGAGSRTPPPAPRCLRGRERLFCPRADTAASTARGSLPPAAQLFLSRQHQNPLSFLTHTHTDVVYR